MERIVPDHSAFRKRNRFRSVTGAWITSQPLILTTERSGGDAHRGNGKRFVVRADEKLTAFVELESAMRGCG
jgi:hypothetical protein